MITVTLYGWDMDTWERAIEWAGSNLKPSDMLDDSKRDEFLKVRTKWLNSGGPHSGPRTNFHLKKETAR